MYVGMHGGEAIPFYHEAGYVHITVITPSPDEAWGLRSSFPSAEVVGASCAPAQDKNALRLDAVVPTAQTVIVNDPGNELAILAGVPWDSVDLLIVSTNTASKATGFASAFDLVTEVVTTRGFVEVDRWTRDLDGVLDVAFMKGARL